ncbi:uncharacterized protein DNG_08681 [Cephalotrichum gorgonifer]|uniref:Putative transcription factor kapC n=1 Tax=Cephalotrichum gorgonifer TaxID=2041049 RepID=A0AAE8N4P0_9PEZI|nr:uncharacterized protein DNG_08681 [Cephalotrichum gorgonifer]
MEATLPDADLQASLELLRSHAATSPSGEGQSPPDQTPSAVSPHGYADITAAANQAHRALTDGQRQQQQAHVKEDDYIHPDLRAHANTMMPAAAASLAPAANMMPSNMPMPTMAPQDPTPPAVVHEQQVLAPAPPPPQPTAQSPEDNEDSPNNRRGKRELSQSKRAAQNRAAQRAFRRRKEEYIKKLEERVNDNTQLDNSCRYLISQNTLYREYVSALQSELLEARGKFPAPPQGLNLSPQMVNLPEAAPRPEQPPTSAAPEPLAAIAQAVMTPPAPLGDRQPQQQPDGQDEQEDMKMQMESLP